MSKTIEQACQDAICHLQKQRVNDRILERCKESFFDGAEFMKKEYEEKLRWIPVEEKLPKNYTPVIAYNTYPNLCYVVKYDSVFGFMTNHFNQRVKITHWRYIL